MPHIEVKGRTFDKFCEEEKIDPKKLNEANPGKIAKFRSMKAYLSHPGVVAERKSWLDEILILWVPAPGEPDVDPGAQTTESPFEKLLSDRDGWWKNKAKPKQHLLAYETLRNVDNFLKGPGKTSVGLYVAPLSEFRVEADECIIKDDTYANLRKAIFPTLDTVKKLEARANLSAAREIRVLKNLPIVNVKPTSQPNSTINVATNVQNKKDATNHIVVLPYNYEDNTRFSHAIGTEKTQTQKHLEAEWPMWKTASRSCYVEVSPVDYTAIKIHETVWPWCYDCKAPGRLKPHKMDSPFDIKTLDVTRHFSIKTGVEWVGTIFQGGAAIKTVQEWDAHTPHRAAKKDQIEGNSVLAMMRSYLIRKIDKKHRNAPEFAAQLEVLTVSSNQEGGDGFQVRELTKLDKDMWHIPALSVPYAGPELMQEASNEALESYKSFLEYYTAPEFWKKFEAITAPGKTLTVAQSQYACFWGVAYALFVAMTKAELLLRYSLIPATPNPQNFVIAFDDTLAPAHPIVRDVGDFMVHKEIAAAYWLSDKDWQKCNGVIPDKLDGLSFTNPLIAVEYSEKVARHYVDDLKMEKNTLPFDNHYQIKGQAKFNLLNWAYNSTFKVWGEGTWGDKGGLLTEKMLAMWGALHNEVLMHHIQRYVGIDLEGPRKHNRDIILPLNDYDTKDEDALFPEIHAAITTPDSLEKFRQYAKKNNIHDAS